MKRLIGDSGGGTPGGSDTQVQFNDGGAFGGDAGLVFDKTTDALTIAGPVVHPIGAAATPSLTFTGDINTGIYSPGADQLAISTSGTGRLFVSASGDVAIGTTNTGYGTLGVYQATNGLLSVVNSTSYGQLQQNGSDLYINWNLNGAAGGNLIFRSGSSSTERARIDSSGRLGLGTSSPSSLLHLADAGNITVGTTTGTKIGTATTQKLGFYNKTPVVQPTAIADATNGASTQDRLNDLLAAMRTLGLIAT